MNNNFPFKLISSIKTNNKIYKTVIGSEQGIINDNLPMKCYTPDFCAGLLGPVSETSVFSYKPNTPHSKLIAQDSIYAPYGVEQASFECDEVTKEAGFLSLHYNSQYRRTSATLTYDPVIDACSIYGICFDNIPVTAIQTGKIYRVDHTLKVPFSDTLGGCLKNVLSTIRMLLTDFTVGGVIDTSGVDCGVNMLHREYSKGYYNRSIFRGDRDPSRTTKYGLIAGNGDSITYNDYQLTSVIPHGETSGCLYYVNSDTFFQKIPEMKLAIATLSSTVSNRTSDPITITELGVIHRTYPSYIFEESSYPTIYKYIMYIKTKPVAPVIVLPGEDAELSISAVIETN